MAASMREFDPVRLGGLECSAWAAYYRRDWPRAVTAFVGMVRTGFALPWVETMKAAWWVLRANQAWAPYPDNDPPRCVRLMTRFYRLVAQVHAAGFDPAEAARLEVAWWAAHRARQREGAAGEELVEALTALTSLVYEVDPSRVRESARLRADAMDVSDRWVARGCRPDDPALAAERSALIRAYAALLAAVHRP